MIIDSRIDMKLNTALSAIMTNTEKGKNYYSLYCDNVDQAKELKKLLKQRGYKCGFILADPSEYNEQTCYFKIKWKK